MTASTTTTTTTPARPTGPAARPTAAARAVLRSEVSVAARVVAPSWPIETFIAVNPLSGFEDRPFADAVAAAGELYGARGTLDEAAFRAAHAAGRVTDGDLRAALVRECGPALDEPPVRLGPLVLDRVELLRHDLLGGRPAPAPVRRVLTRSERVAPGVAATVDALTARWCAAFLGAGVAGWPMPGADRGFYPAWRDLAPHDRSLPRGVRARLRALPDSPEDALLGALDALGVTGADRADHLRAHLTRLPGWAAHVRWQGEHGGGIDLLAYLAVRLVYEAEHLRDAGLLDADPPADPPAADPAARPAAEESARARAERIATALGVGTRMTGEEFDAAAAVLAALPAARRGLVWLSAYEAHYRDGLLAALARDVPARPAGRPAAQLVTCIDVRSEGLRRHLEALGPYETYGFAGFFGVAIRFHGLDGGRAPALCPVLIEARNDVAEQPAPTAADVAQRHRRGRRALAGAEDGFHAAKDDVVAPFALAEAAGWAAGPLAAAKTLLPGVHGRVRSRLRRWVAPVPPTVVGASAGFTPEERAQSAEVALTTMGLTRDFARLVVLCGHGSTTENNPYASSLDCGACGGNRGAPNARTAAALLNDPDVRAHLATRGIAVPADTWFVAAEHDTALDAVTLLDRHLVPPGHRDDLDRLAADLAEAGARLGGERSATLPGAPAGADARGHLRRRSADWAQVYPEWGLAGNAAFVVGPRSMTAGLDLGRRTFLHSYDPDVDPDGTALETILTAPLIVAQWINCQYYASTVAPEVFGSGTKTVHNAIGGTGVLSGYGGDLRLGLPRQSVADGDRLVHEPVRLLAVVQAPLARTAAVVDRNPVLRRLFDGGWMALAAREHAGAPWQQHTPRGWTPWPTSEATP